MEVFVLGEIKKGENIALNKSIWKGEINEGELKEINLKFLFPIN